MLKISTHTHPRRLVEGLLSETLDEIQAKSRLPPEEYARHKRAFLSKDDCISKSSIKYSFMSAALFHSNYPASECRLNVDEHYITVISPAKDFFETLPHNDSELYDELFGGIKHELQEAQVPVEFEDMEMPSRFQCAGSYYQLTQVIYRQTLVHGTLTKVVLVAPSCKLTLFDSSLKDTYTTAVTVDIPVNGTFLCSQGRLPTCSMSKATTKSPQLRFAIDGSEVT